MGVRNDGETERALQSPNDGGGIRKTLKLTQSWQRGLGVFGIISLATDVVDANPC